MVVTFSRQYGVTVTVTVTQKEKD
jgi:hypothetical protein